METPLFGEDCLGVVGLDLLGDLSGASSATLRMSEADLERIEGWEWYDLSEAVSMLLLLGLIVEYW